MNIKKLLIELGFIRWYPTTMFIERALELLEEDEASWHLWRVLEVDHNLPYDISEWHIRTTSLNAYLRETSDVPLWDIVKSHVPDGRLSFASAEDIIRAIYACYKEVNGK